MFLRVLLKKYDWGNVKMEQIMESKEEYLEKMFAKELKRLRTLIFKYQHRSLLKHKLKIVIGNLEYINAAGLYEAINGANEYDYSHKVTICEEYINLYFTSIDPFWKRYYKKIIKKTVIHELCHALTYELYNNKTEIKGVNNDASPIFLCLLYFCGGETHHDCKRAFLKSKAYRETCDAYAFEEIDMYLRYQLIQYDRIAASLKNKNTNNTLTTNSFSFASRDAGLLANISIQKTIKYTDIKQTIYVTNNIFEIGACITAKDIEKLVNKKIKSRKFEIKKSEYIYSFKNVTWAMNNGRLNKRLTTIKQ